MIDSYTISLSNTVRVTEASLKKRYLYKLAAGVVSMGINIAINAIVPRGLGPENYGNFSYLSNFFTQVTGFLDTGSSTGFYTKLSQRPNEPSLVSFYFLLSGIIAIGIMSFVYIAGNTSVCSSIWPGQGMLYVYMAAVWGLLTWYSQVLNQMVDAYGLTVSSEKVRIAQRGLALGLIVLLFMSGRMTLKNFFYYHYFILILICVAFVWIMERYGLSFRSLRNVSFAQIRSHFQEFYHYCHPLYLYAGVALVMGLFDRWLLQVFGGSTQQGFYGLSYQIGAVCFLFTSALTPLLMREFAIAYDRNDISKMAQLFRRYIPSLYAVAAFFACFISVQANDVARIMGGDKFGSAAIVIAIMAFYPIHQTYGQLSGSIFYATGKTRQFRNIGIVFLIIGLPMTFILVAPKKWLGLNVGAAGLAIKMVVVQFFAVNVQLYYNSKMLKLPYWRYLAHQIGSVACLLGSAALATLVTGRLFELSVNPLVSFISTGILYTLMVVGLVYLLPDVVGLKRHDIHSLFKLCTNRIEG